MSTSSSKPASSGNEQAADRLSALARARSEQALRLVCANLPWLSSLVYAVSLHVDERVRVAAVTATGRVLVNPQVFAELPLRDAVFVLAHELLHLALDTFGRKSLFDDHETVNRAHDYIINDMLRQELNMSPPLNGLDLLGASEKSLEQIIAWMNQSKDKLPPPCWQWNGGHGTPPAVDGTLSRAMRDAGLLPAPGTKPTSPDLVRSWHLDNLDAIPDELERELFPDERQTAKRTIAKLGQAVAKSLSLRELARHLDEHSRTAGGSGNTSIELTALRGSYAPPWELVLQHWLEAQSPGDRSYARPSRRGADRTDCVLPGRTRIGWTLHIVLDTSGSMLDDLPRILGTIADFCESTGVAVIHLIQCGDTLAADDWVLVEDVSSVTLLGGGDGGLSPGFERLAADPEVTAALIITDTYEEYPQAEPPFNVLWAVIHNQRFEPPYGTVIVID